MPTPAAELTGPAGFYPVYLTAVGKLHMAPHRWHEALDALLESGRAQPRRPALAGAPSLTAAERRVSQLASEGLSNREIAQALFVTVKTVELQLTKNYRKLAIPGRGRLPAALGPPH
jgi:DNA-binding CsgD family transcriptional regulator